MIAGADRANIGVVVPFIRNSFHLTNTDIGAMTSLFYIPYALIQIPSGFFFGKYGVRKLFTLSIILNLDRHLCHGYSSFRFPYESREGSSRVIGRAAQYRYRHDDQPLVSTPGKRACHRDIHVVDKICPRRLSRQFVRPLFCYLAGGRSFTRLPSRASS